MVNEAVPLLSTDEVWSCQEEDSNEESLMLVCLAPSLFGSAGRGPFPRIIPSRRCHPTAVSAPAKPQPIVPQPGMVRRSRYKCHYSGPSPLCTFQAR